MPSLKDLFKTKPLPTQNNKVGSEVYAVRNSKDIRITTANGILNATIFPLVQKTLRSSGLLTARTKENLVESELVGLRAIRGLASPVIYGTDIIRLKRRTTNVLDVMKNAAAGSDGVDNGIIGNFIDRAKDKALELASKIGIAFPETLIPTRIALNDKFKKGLEPNTMATLAEIKKDGAGTILGQFLAKNVKGTPNQIGRQVIGSGIDVLKGKVRKKLFGSPLVGGQNLANKSLSEVQYDSVAFYSNTVFPQTDDISVRNDLSSILAERTILLESIKVGGDGSQKLSSGVSNLSKAVSSNSKISNPSPFTPISDIIKDTGIKNKDGLTLARKTAQKEIAKPENNTEDFQFKEAIPYSNTVDVSANEISLRNDLSTMLQSLKDSSTGFPLNNSTDTTSISTKLPSLTDSEFGNPADKIKSLTSKNQTNLSQGRLAGQREIAKLENIGNDFQFNDGIEYSNTVDETADDISLRNDLSTKLQSLNAALAVFSPVSGGIDRTNTKYSQKEFSEKTLARRNWTTTSDFINSKPPYAGSDLSLGTNNEVLGDYDFIPVKFTSILGGKSVNFTAVLDGISESVSPTWDSAKFLGSPFNYYTYSGIERTVSFNLKLFSLNPSEHVIMWQKIDFLTSLTYPISYNGDPGYIVPPFLRFTMGNLYKNKECFISSLSYTMDDVGGWEIGTPILGDSKIDVFGQEVNLNEYKLPRLVSVSITLTFIESRGNTSGQKYGFGTKVFSNNDIANVN